MTNKTGLEFKVGDAVVYPAHGVGKVAAVETQEVAGMSLEVYVVTFDHEKMTLRVPAGSYDSIVTLIAGLGEEVLSRREWTDDVTAEYLDLDARIKTQEVHLDQLQKLYSKGGTIKEMMELEQEIARVTSDIESMKGRFRFLTHQVDFSTITVRLYEPGSATPIKPPKTVMERVNLEFTNSWHGAVNFTGNAVVFLAGAVPVLVYLAIVGGVAYLVLRYARRFFRRPPQG